MSGIVLHQDALSSEALGKAAKRVAIFCRSIMKVEMKKDKCIRNEKLMMIEIIVKKVVIIWKTKKLYSVGLKFDIDTSRYILKDFSSSNKQVGQF